MVNNSFRVQCTVKPGFVELCTCILEPSFQTLFTSSYVSLSITILPDTPASLLTTPSNLTLKKAPKCLASFPRVH